MSTEQQTGRTDADTTTGRRSVRLALAVLGVLLVASCLRPAITSVGPVLPDIGADKGLGSSALGLLAALPLLAFAGVSPLAHRLGRGFGVDRSVLFSLLLLIVGIVVRSLGAGGLLWTGTVLLGIGVAIGNVLVPVVVKRDFPTQIARMTGAYTAVMNTVAALGSGIAVPLAGLTLGPAPLHGWPMAIGVWAIPAAVAVLIWIARMRVVTKGPVPIEMWTAGARPSVWRSVLAWQVTLTMGLQSTVFYTLVTWLPSMEADAKIPPAAAGAHLFVYQAVGIGSALAVSALMSRARDQRLIASLITVPILIALAGMLISPGLVLVWVGFAGLTSGGSITVALALIGLRTRVPADTARLSGMTQGVGYLLAACGPIVAGWMRGATGSWATVIALLIVLTVLQGIVGYLAGRNRFVGDPHGSAAIPAR